MRSCRSKRVFVIWRQPIRYQHQPLKLPKLEEKKQLEQFYKARKGNLGGKNVTISRKQGFSKEIKSLTQRTGYFRVEIV